MNRREVRCAFSASKAARAQLLLRGKVRLEPLPTRPRTVLGLDASYSAKDGVGVGAAVLISLETLEPVDCRVYISRVCIPYIPGLLAFRELAVMAPAAAALSAEADVVMVDGHGIAHPRRFGIASHVGVILERPSIGVAKKKLVGTLVEGPGGMYVVQDGERLAIVLGTRPREVYVSPGHRITLEEAASIARATIRPGGWMPEPTRLADVISKALKTIIGGQSLINSALASLCRVKLGPRLEELERPLRRAGLEVE
ncbi:endonuclease V [Aeropyrum pernix]|uniref:Endonuclease V n=1 Tax=Aeropyrum pernix (strain ATCC 700893 / DSM 11879 / JCM 9820 / NBRC 100138 / K1) TaxID=272557 RepID=NFI_AERPE|nr:endonuclease V [Aeropyrum pernix]Q9YES5.2 RecName: Full=Endonuclease V; AltName: Full=Deoxyinosine 3'endonuclease; AltName: Full=Deoxyribonuclease V; Short=DNase V [Aeropyrum pernix K1]